MSRNNQSGFTIIEVLIVLAITGMIMSLIFLVIPGLQRASRNSQRKQDAATILSAVSRYELNHGGSIPNCAVGLCAGAGNFLNGIQLSFYSATTISAEAKPALEATVYPPLPGGIDDVYIYNHYKCVTNPVTGALTADSTGAGYHDVVALFSLEKPDGSAQFQCKAL